MCTSERGVRYRSGGFSLIELLVGLALAVLVAASVAPLWGSLQSSGVRAADRTVGAVQGRVAVSRLERDLRLASAGGCPFAAAGPVLEASASQVVFLRRAATGSKPILVEWEVVGGSLMRRWGPCPDETPSTYPHSNFSDNKTMLENLGNGSSLEYVVNGMLVSPPVAGTDLAAIDAVVLTLQIGRGPAHVNDSMVTTGRVGR